MARGRPPKFGRPSTLLALTLPQDTVEYLQSMDTDVGWAIVKLADRLRGVESAAESSSARLSDAELLPIGPDQFLIVVREQAFSDLPDVSLVPLGQGRAFLAFPKHTTVESLELALIDHLEAGDLGDAQRERYAAFRDILRTWRHDATLTFHERSIVVVERRTSRRERRDPP